MTKVSVLAVCAVLACGCATDPHGTVENLTAGDVNQFVGKSHAALVGSLGEPSSERIGKSKTSRYWEYQGEDRVCVFYSQDGRTVDEVNVGKDAKEAYSVWGSTWVTGAE